MGAATALSPEAVWAAPAADWTIAVGDVEADLPRRAMRLVRGRLPAGLSGTLFRNGPGKFRRGAGEPAHWFDGDGLVRSFRIGDGRASLSARFVDTQKRRTDAAAGRMVVSGFGTPGTPEGRLGKVDDANAANTSVLALPGKLWALWEAGSPVAVDPETLETRGFVTLRPDLAGMPFLAHPRVEPEGRVWNLGFGGGQAIVWRLSADGALEDATLIPIPRASYVHDFTATDREIVIVLQPWVREGGGMPLADHMAWRPELGTQVLVLDKADLTRRRVYELEPFFFFHLGDAWREADGTIRFDGCVSDDAAFVSDAIGGITDRRDSRVRPPSPALFALHPGGRAEVRRLAGAAEFPKGDARFAGRPRRYTWHVSGKQKSVPLATGFAVTDLARGRTERFGFGQQHIVEEAVFVPRPGGSREGDGWAVGTTLNLKARATELHVFEALRISAGPLCTFRADVPLPVGFHGAFVQA
jgi:carotenoid cleavage dioxygenase-like enzyme